MAAKRWRKTKKIMKNKWRTQNIYAKKNNTVALAVVASAVGAH